MILYDLRMSVVVGERIDLIGIPSFADHRDRPMSGNTLGRPVIMCNILNEGFAVNWFARDGSCRTFDETNSKVSPGRLCNYLVGVEF
jgi:hypothetical protein